MECLTVPNSLPNIKKRHHNTFTEDYRLDMWLEFKKRWLIFGVLLSILMAVVSPRVGAPGGPLHSEYVSYVPLWYVYYSAGRRSWRRGGPPAGLACACALTAAHAYVVSPALCALVANFARDAGLHQILIQGALLSSAGGPCAWLSLSVARDTASAAILLTTSYVTSLMAVPLTLYIICGRAPLPALGPSILSALSIVPPFIAGLIYTHIQTQKHNTPSKNCTHNDKTVPDCIHCVTNCTQCVMNRTKHVMDCTQLMDCAQCVKDCMRSMERCMLVARVCALLLLYFDCCERLREAEGSLHLRDVLGTMLFALSYVTLSTLSCMSLSRLSPAASSLAVCAVPKAMHSGWQVSSSCVPAGLSRLPAVLLAPAQALCLAAIDAGGTGGTRGTLPW